MFYDVSQLSDNLKENTDIILDILEELECENISYRQGKKEVRFSRDSDTNPTSIKLNLENLSYRCFSNNTRGNIYSLIMERKNLEFNETLRYVAKKLGITGTVSSKKVKLPFGGFYKTLIKQTEEPESLMQTYDVSILDPYLNKPNMLFFNDGINFQTQEEYQIGYDLESNSILIPEWTLDGRLCGIQGRLNDSKCKKEDRWWAFLPCSRSLTLFGYHRNYSHIQRKGLCIIAESEKSPMKLTQMDCHIGLAVCGCNISPTQAKYLKSLMIPKYIIAFDEGLDEEDVIRQCEKIKVSNKIFENKVGYVFDKYNKYLPKDSKLSPCDMPADIFAKLIEECTFYI